MSAVAMVLATEREYSNEYGEGHQYDRIRSDKSEKYVFWN